MHIHGLPITLNHSPPVIHGPTSAAAAALSSTAVKYPLSRRHKPPQPPFATTPAISVPPFQSFTAASSKGDSEDGSDGDLQEVIGADGIEVEIQKLSKNRRRIRSKVAVEASLQTIWGILTDYDKLADFIPALAVSQVLDKRNNFVRLLQIGQQNLAFGLKFNAKGIVDCYEKDFESFPYGQRRDIEFKMIEGDFELFEGKWSIEQSTVSSQGYHTTLSYAVDVKPKMWLPVQLVEGRLCKEIKVNLFCIREAAQKASANMNPLV